MAVELKTLAEQVIVVTGASSGIGLCTARIAAGSGARVVLASRNESALRHISADLGAEGRDTAYVAADVGNETEVQKIADIAIQRFGGFDTWVNNAGVSIYGKVEDVPLEDARRLFDTDFWGVVHGSHAAMRHLKSRGGAIINVGSVVSDRAIPLQGFSSAAKHAVKGFTDALRMELEHDGAPISVTLIKPTTIDTMYATHAKNYTGGEPTLPAPIYTPEVAAEAILHAAQYPMRDVLVGGGAKIISAGAYYARRFMDKYMERTMFDQQLKNEADTRGQDNLHQPAADLKERRGHEGNVIGTSLYTKAALHPKTTLVAMIGMGVAARAILRARANGPR